VADWPNDSVDVPKDGANCPDAGVACPNIAGAACPNAGADCAADEAGKPNDGADCAKRPGAEAAELDGAAIACANPSAKADKHQTQIHG